MSETQSRSNQIVDGLKHANKVIQTRFLVIALLMIVGITIAQLKSTKDYTFDAMYSDRDFLREMRDADNLQVFLKRNQYKIQSINYSESGSLLYKLEKANYRDKMPIIEEIDRLSTKLNDRERDKDLENKTTNINGIEIPLYNWMSFVPFILLVLFHDLVRIIKHRRTLLEQFKNAGLDEWEQGPGILGLNIYWKADERLNFTQLIETIISFALLVSPLACAYLFSQLNTTANSWLFYGELLCLIIIGIDLIIVIYRENIFQFGSLVDICIGENHWQNGKNKKFKTMASRILLPFVSFFLTILTEVFAPPHKSAGHSYLFIITISALVLSITLWLCNKFPKDGLLKSFRVAIFAVNLCWFMLLVFMCLTKDGYTRLPLSNEPIMETVIVISILSFCIGTLKQWLLNGKSNSVNS